MSLFVPRRRSPLRTARTWRTSPAAGAADSAGRSPWWRGERAPRAPGLTRTTARSQRTRMRTGRSRKPWSTSVRAPRHSSVSAAADGAVRRARADVCKSCQHVVCQHFYTFRFDKNASTQGDLCAPAASSSERERREILRACVPTTHVRAAMVHAEYFMECYLCGRGEHSAQIARGGGDKVGARADSDARLAQPWACSWRRCRRQAPRWRWTSTAWRRTRATKSRRGRRRSRTRSGNRPKRARTWLGACDFYEGIRHLARSRRKDFHLF
jgi:hypothetical protein